MSRRRTLSKQFNDRDVSTSGSINKVQMKPSISELNEVMNYIKYEWPQVLEPNANPIELAISLLDDSSVGMAYKLPEFEDISDRVSSALRHVVNDHHEVFNNVIGGYHTLLNSSKLNQRDANDIKQLLESTKKEMHDKSDTLQELNSTSIRYNEMIDILDAMDYLNSLPDKIEQLTLEKRIHQIYDIIANGHAVADKYNLWSLGAMSSIRNYLDVQSNSLFDLIIDELNGEIYLKASSTVQSENSWELLITSNNNPKLSGFKTFVSKLNKLEQFIYNSANLDLNEIGESFNELINEFLYEQLPVISNSAANSSALTMTLDLSGNCKNYHYIYQLLMTAQKLNRLPQTITLLFQSNQQEYHGLLYRTIEETKLKNLLELSKLKKLNDLETEFDDELVNFNDFSIKILKDLFSAIFTKTLMVLQKQKLVHVIAKKFDLSYDLTGSWNTIKNEISNFIMSYISNKVDYISQINKSNVNELFKFENIEFSNNEIIDKFSNLIEKNQEYGDYENDYYIMNESFQSNLQVLVPINIFNMRIISEFFLIFISSITNLLTEESKPTNTTAIKFFENFMKIQFLPKLRDSFDDKFKKIIGPLTEEREDELVDTTSTPIFKTDLINVNEYLIYQNAFEFKKFFISMCFTLNTSLTYRKELNNLALHFLKKFHDSYSSFYLSLVGSNNTKIDNWMKTPALNELSSLIIYENGEINDELLNKETEIMLFNSDVLEVTKDDLLDNESLDQLCYLILTSSWILGWLPNLRKESNYNYEEDLSTIDRLKHDWNFLESGKRYISDETLSTNSANLSSNIDNLNIYLSLNAEKFDEFNEILDNFARIKLNSLIILRYDLRLKSIYFITKSYRLTQWVLNNEPGDADQYISRLNKEIFAMENKLTNFLEEEEISKIFIGMSRFLNELLIKSSSLIKKINNNGIKKLIANIFTLLQMLKNLNKSNTKVDFEKSSHYFELFTRNENQWPERLKRYNEWEKNNLVRLLYSEKIIDGKGSSFNMTKYNDLLSKVNK